MYLSETLDAAFQELGEIAPAGYAAGLKLRLTGPSLIRGTYPAKWTEHYAENLMAFWDPSVVWALANTGYSRWSALKIPDPLKIMKQARAYGMNFGASISVGEIPKRSILGIARSDREFSDAEIHHALGIFTGIHDLVLENKSLTHNQTEALKLIAEGDFHSVASEKLGISESALKARLKGARLKLNARTTLEAIARAKEFYLF